MIYLSERNLFNMNVFLYWKNSERKSSVRFSLGKKRKQNNYCNFIYNLTLCKMMDNMQIEQTPIAAIVHEPVKCIQIPPGLRPGDSFIVTPDNCPPFTVVVPEGATPGMFVNVVVPLETRTDGSSYNNSQNNRDYLKIDKAVAGAAVVGGVVGLIAIGTVGAVVFAGGAAYAATRTDSKIGQNVRKIGDKSYNGLSKAKNWAVEQMMRCNNGGNY
jgi:hypothetical protein